MESFPLSSWVKAGKNTLGRRPHLEPAHALAGPGLHNTLITADQTHVVNSCVETYQQGSPVANTLMFIKLFTLTFPLL